MNQLDLRLFVRLSQKLHFGEAARSENIAQSALSARIKGLEHRLGTPLFIRSTRSVVLTAAGQAFLPEAIATLRQMGKAERAARIAANKALTSIGIGGVDSALSGTLPSVIKKFLEQNPTVEATLTESLSHVTEQALITRQIDVGFMRYRSDRTELESIFLAQEDMYVALPNEHPLAGQPAIKSIELGASQFVMQSRTQRPVLHDTVRQYFEHQRMSFHVKQEANERHMLLSLVAAGLGISLVPEWMTSFAREGVTFRPLVDGGPKLDLFMVWRKSDPLDALQKLLGNVTGAFGAQLIADGDHE